MSLAERIACKAKTTTDPISSKPMAITGVPSEGTSRLEEVLPYEEVTAAVGDMVTDPTMEDERPRTRRRRDDDDMDCDDHNPNM